HCELVRDGLIVDAAVLPDGVVQPADRGGLRVGLWAGHVLAREVGKMLDPGDRLRSRGEVDVYHARYHCQDREPSDDCPGQPAAYAASRPLLPLKLLPLR